MNALDIELALTRGPFPWRKYVCVPNLSWGLLPHEADLACLSESGYLHEVEIKISVADLRRDAAKVKHRREPCPLIRSFTYAMPRSVWEKVEAAPPIPEYAGVVVVNHTANTYDQTTRVRAAAPNARARALTLAERAELGRLGTMRYWARCHPAEAQERRRQARDWASVLPLPFEVSA